ncbi:MAG TPA: sodium:calcium antiporter [Afifellaceae bacterium]|nr:sodium:calcium antiporter [Afifellaceae bacterium]
MAWISPEEWPLWLSAAAFCIAAGFVWFAGVRLARHADAIAEMTGLGSAVIGMLLLGGITSLPEIAVSATASLGGNAPLAVNNILGGVALQVAVIALGDAALRGRPLSSAVPGQTILLQAIFCSLILAMVAAGVIVGDIALFGLGLWTSAILAVVIAMFWILARHRDRPEDRPHREGEGIKPERQPRRSLGWEIRRTALMAAIILVAGFVLARTSEALAEQTGFGQSFFGAIFTGLATSLPEISTVLGAVWLGRYAMAFADIFGTNIFDLALLFLVDAAYAGPPVLNEVGAFSAFAAVLGLALTLIYAAGLIGRRTRTMLRLGPDSLAVVLVYLFGVAILFTLR